MARIIVILVVTAIGALLIPGVWCQSSPPATNSVIRELLERPAPPPKTAKIIKLENGDPRPDNFYSKNHVPADDANINDLIDYWAAKSRAPGHQGLAPSPAVNKRLLEACEDDLSKCVEFLPVLTRSSGFDEHLKKLLEESLANPDRVEGWEEPLYSWLKRNTRFYFDDLVASARKTKDSGEWGVLHGDDLEGLAHLDWDTALPLLERFAVSDQAQTATLALGILYEHANAADPALADRYRSKLQVIVNDKDTKRSAREKACDILSLTEWEGRDDWYLSLLKNGIFQEDGDQSFMRPLRVLPGNDPDKWIPILANLVGGKDRLAHNAAVYGLTQFNGKGFNSNAPGPRKDAMLPLLPWLGSPDWALDVDDARRDLIWALSAMDIPESIPGMIWIVQNDKTNKRYALDSLARYKDPRIAPVLRQVLAKGSEDDSSMEVIRALIASGGISPEELADGIAAYAVRYSVPGGTVDVAKTGASGTSEVKPAPMPIPVEIGLVLIIGHFSSDQVAEKVLAKLHAMEKSNLPAAKVMMRIVLRWNIRSVNVDIIRQIGSGKADSDSIATVIDRRVTIRETDLAELSVLADLGGMAKGIGLVLLDDQVGLNDLLGGTDRDAQIAMLACARLAGTELNIEKVNALFKVKSDALSLAAEKYLISEDSLSAQEIVFARHKNEAFISGWRAEDPDRPWLVGLTTKSFDQKLNNEMVKETAPEQIFALITENSLQQPVIRVFKNKAVLTVYDGDSRYRERQLTDSELETLKAELSKNDPYSTGPTVTDCSMACAFYEFLMISRDRGRRVFFSIYEGNDQPFILKEIFNTFSETGIFQVHYHVENEIKGAEIIFADDEHQVSNVWKQGSDIRLLVKQPHNQWHSVKPGSVDEDDEEDQSKAAIARRQFHYRSNEQDKFFWRSLKGTRLGNIAEAPPPFALQSWKESTIDGYDFPESNNQRIDQAQSGNVVLLAGNDEPGGLWKSVNQGKPVQISGTGIYSNPVLTSDGKWAMAEKAERGSGARGIVRIDMTTGKEYPLDLSKYFYFGLRFLISAQNRVLIFATESEGSINQMFEKASYFLVDPATGRMEQVHGNLMPFTWPIIPRLQPTQHAGEFWVAIKDSSHGQTEITRYDTADFSLHHVMTVPSLVFWSDQMWVDETEGKVYVVHDGQVLRIPLNTQTPKK